MTEHIKFCDSRFSFFCMWEGCFTNLGSGVPHPRGIPERIILPDHVRHVTVTADPSPRGVCRSGCCNRAGGQLGQNKGPSSGNPTARHKIHWTCMGTRLQLFMNLFTLVR